MRRLKFVVGLIGLVIGLAVHAAPTELAGNRKPILYKVRFPTPDKHIAEVFATIPTGQRPTVELRMAVWSPGFYRVEDYARNVHDLTVIRPDGTELRVEQTKNRWLIHDAGPWATVAVSYRLTCDRKSVTQNWVSDDLIVLNGAASFVTLAGQPNWPHEVHLELPAGCKRSITAMAPAPDGLPDHYRAEDYDTLVDSPIVAGDLSIHEFEVEGSKHVLADAGEVGPWDGEKASRNLERMVRETHRFWGFLPFRRYVFLNVFRAGGGGLEHKDSTLLTSSPRGAREPGSVRWLSFVSHEYFHAFNVKRLRPVELGPFDYEHPPSTKSLWISEGLTTYFGDLILARAGLASTQEFLNLLSTHIGQLQNARGRLAQSLEDASLDVWNSGTSGVGRDSATKLSYYVKGPVVGFVLDARIRRATGDKKSLDDVMKLAYQRYSGERGFTPEQFRAVAEEVAGVDLKEWFRKAISSTEELDYQEALDWYGLRFKPDEDPSKVWKLEIRTDAMDVQKEHLRAWLDGAAGA
ncbi:MAG: M61 family metallopeptidase [Isosphaeraceae bacterium]